MRLLFFLEKKKMGGGDVSVSFHTFIDGASCSCFSVIFPAVAFLSRASWIDASACCSCCHHALLYVFSSSIPFALLIKLGTS
jgi:hypothetical protein